MNSTRSASAGWGTAPARQGNRRPGGLRYQPWLPGPPLKGPARSEVIQPP